MRLSLLIDLFENTGGVLWEPDVVKRHKDDFLLDPFVKTDNEKADNEHWRSAAPEGSWLDRRLVRSHGATNGLVLWSIH